MDENQALLPRRPDLAGMAHLPAAQTGEGETREFDSFAYLQSYWTIINKRRWTIVSVAFIVTVLVAIATFRMTPIYQATVRLDIEADTPQIQSLNDLYRDISTYGDETFIGTQIQVLEGGNMAEMTIDQLGLAKDKRAIAAIEKLPAPDPSQPPPPQGTLDQLFENSLHVQRVRDSHVVNVSFESADPKLSALVANSLADNYIENNFRQKYDATRQASGWMEKQLDELKVKVEKSQQALVDYEKQNAIVNVNEKEDRQNVTQERMADLSRDLTIAQTDRLQKESVYEMVRTNQAQVAYLVQDDLLQKLEEKHADLKSQYIDVLGQSGPKHPKAQRLQSQLDEVQSLIDRERKRILDRIQNDYMAALEREKLLTAAVAKEKTQVGALNQLLIQHNLLKREADTNQQLYESLLQRLKDATVSAGLRATNIHVIDPAKPPERPVRPQKLRNILVGLMVGLVLGLTFAFIKEAVDTSIKSIDEAERLAKAPALAVVPMAHETLRQQLPTVAGGRGGGSALQGLAILTRPTSAMAESFRTLLTSVILSMAPHPPQVLLVTSSIAGEGKTTTATNLAVALAQRGEPTVLIDADLRHPRIADSLDLSNGAGLAGFLTGAHNLQKALVPFPAVPSLRVMAAGPKPPNPTQLLSSTVMESLLKELRNQFRFVVIDSPPLLPVADTMILSTFVDGVIFVVASGVTVRGAVTRARRILHNSGANLLGIVFNKVDLRYDGYYGSYSHYNFYYTSDDKWRKDNAGVATTEPTS